MALTKVSGHIIDQPFDVGIITATNQYVSGVATVGTMHVTGNLQVDGTTTTLDTVVTEVDRLEVGANNNTVAVAVTQSGSGDAAYFMGGDIGINTTTPRALVDFGPGTGNGTLNQTVANYQAVFEAPTGTGNYTRNIAFASRTSAISAAINAVDEGGSDATGLIIATGNAGAIAERVRIKSDGKVGIGSNLSAEDTDAALTVQGSSALTNLDQTLMVRDSNTDNAAGRGGNLGFAGYVDGTLRTLAAIGGLKTNSGNSFNGDLAFYTRQNAVANLDEKLRITSTGNIGIGTENAVAKVDVVTGTGDGTQNEANCLRLRNRANNGNAMTLQVGVNTAAAGALNQGYAYLQGRFWGGGNNPILLNPKGGNVGIGRTSAHVPLDVNGDVILRTEGHTTQGDLTRKYGFTGSNNSSNPHSYIAGVADQQYWYQGLGLVFGTVRGNDIGGTLGVERMRISSDGKVGIGTDNPASTLDVAGNGQFKNNGAAVKIESVPGSNFTQVQFKNDGGSFYVGRENDAGNWFGTGSNYASVLRSDGAYPLIFRVNGADRFRITGFGTCRLPDDGKLTLGDGDDLQIYHDSTSGKSHIKESGPGLLQVDTNNFSIRNSQDTEQLAYFTENAGVGLYYDNSKKFETTSNGIQISGDQVLNGHLDMRDSDRIRLGASDDLQIYHDGTHSYIYNSTGELTIANTGSGNTLFIQPKIYENSIKAIANGAVELYHDASKKLETTSSGVKVGSTTLITPNTDADNLVIDTGDADSGLSILSSTTGRIYFGDASNDDTGSIRYVHTDNSMRFETNDEERLRILSGGGLTFNGDTAAANALDDYEEGTWTPVPNFGGGTTGITYTTSPTGTYTKIGNLVFVIMGFQFSNKGSSTGSFVVSGLPFSVASTASFKHPNNVVNAHNMANADKVYAALGSGTSLNYRRISDSNADSVPGDGDFTNNSGFYHSLVYVT